MSNQILVIGATGNVGHTLVELLAGKGESVKAATRHPEKYSGPRGAQAVHFDYDQPGTYTAALASVDRMFVIAKTGDAAPETVLIPFLDRARRSGVRHTVLLTARGVEQSEDIGLRKVERHLMASAVDYTILRPTWFMQNFSHGFILPMIQQSGDIFLPAGDGATSFIDTRDIAAVAAETLTSEGHKGKEYGLTGGEALTYAEAAVLISEAAGREIRYVPISDDDMRNSLTATGWSADQANFMASLFFPVRQGWAASVDPAVSSILGRAPITFEEFVQDNKAAWS